MRVSVIAMAFAAAGCVWFAQSQYNPINQTIALSDVPNQPSIFYHEDGLNPQSIQFASNSELMSEAPTFSSPNVNRIEETVKTISKQNDVSIIEKNVIEAEKIIPFGTSVDEVTQTLNKASNNQLEIAKKEILDDIKSNIPKGIPLDPDAFPTDKLVKPIQKIKKKVDQLVPDPIALKPVKKKKIEVKETIAANPKNKISSVSGNEANDHTDRWNQKQKKEINYRNRRIAFTGRHALIDFGKQGAFPKEKPEPQFEDVEITNINSNAGSQAFGTGGSASELELTGIIVPEEDEHVKKSVKAVPLDSHDPTKLESVVEFLPPPPHKDVRGGDKLMVGYVELPPPPKRKLRRPLPSRTPYVSEKPIYVKPF